MHLGWLKPDAPSIAVILKKKIHPYLLASPVAMNWCSCIEQPPAIVPPLPPAPRFALWKEQGSASMVHAAPSAHNRLVFAG